MIRIVPDDDVGVAVSLVASGDLILGVEAVVVREAGCGRMDRRLTHREAEAHAPVEVVEADAEAIAAVHAAGDGTGHAQCHALPDSGRRHVDGV